MDSHSYRFKSRDIARLLAPTILMVLAFAALTHLGALLKLWPRPRPALDIDRTILLHQADAAGSAEASVVFIGDSSCLMNVSAQSLGEQLGKPSLNLGTFSYLGLADFAAIMRARYAANPARRETVVLLMHPEALRRPAPDARYGRILSDYLNGADHCETLTLYHRLSCLLGLEIIRGRILARLLPQPLSGRYGQQYGFTSQLEDSLTKQRGSFVDLEPKPFSGNAEYRLAEALQLQSQAFRAALPPATKLLVGITPVPETFASPEYAAQYQQMLNQWTEWLRPATALTNLPPTLPDRLFSKVTHLNPEGVPIYTRHLADKLAAYLP